MREDQQLGSGHLDSTTTEDERLFAEQTESLRLFQRIAEMSPDAIYVYDFETSRTSYVSARSEQIIGYTTDEVAMLGDRFAIALWHPDDLLSFSGHLRTLRNLADSEIHENEFRVMQPDGRYRWLQSHTSVFARDADGQVQKIVVLTQNITTRKQAEEAVRRSRDELEEMVAERTHELAQANAALQEENAERRHAERVQHRLLQQLVNAQEDERRRIARELHDVTGQALTGLAISLKLLVDSLPPNTEPARQRANELISLAATTMDQIRLLAQDLRPPALDTIGLSLTLSGLCRSFASRTGLEISYVGAVLPELPEAVTIALYRFVQEALTNAAKHSGARRIDVVLATFTDTLSLSVSDDGCGFDLEAVRHGPTGALQFGIIGMQERAELAGGRLAIKTAPGTGTSISLHLPLAAEQEDEG